MDGEAMSMKGIRDLAVLMTVLLVLVISAGTPVQGQATGGQIEPKAGTWKTWILTSAKQLRLSPPPDAAATEGEIRTLRSLEAQRDSTTLDLINFWDVGGPSHRWNEILTDQISKNRFNTPRSARARALLNVAIYDAMIVAWDLKYTFNRPRPSVFKPGLSTVVPNSQSPSYPSEHAVAAGAASAILTYLFPSDARRYEEMAQEAGRSRLLAGVQYPSDVEAGLRLGRVVAEQVIRYARRDGSDAKFTGPIPTGPGYWRGTDPLEPLAGAWKTRVLTSGRQFRPPPPPAYGSTQLAAELAEVKNFPRTPETNQAAFFWQSRGGQFFYDLTNQKIFEHRLDINPPRAARVYALVNIAAYDSTLACWDAKYAYWMIRPVQLDPEVKTLFPTPNHPSYPSTAACSWGATAEVLAYLFPSEAAFFRQKAEDAHLYPFWAGIHFRRDCTVGRDLGRRVAQVVIERAKKDGAQ